MRKPLVLALLVLTSGCAAYFPQAIEITDSEAYASDVAFCQSAAAAYKPSLDMSSVGYGAISGAAQNATGAAVSPLVPAIGAAGGATSALSSGLDLMGQARINVAKHCLLERTHRDRSAIVADPD